MLNKIKITAKIFTFLENVVVDVISSQIDKVRARIHNKQDKQYETELSSLQFEREIRVRLDEMASKVFNNEAIVQQGLRLFEATLNKLVDIANCPNVVINGNVSINIMVCCSSDGVRFVGQKSVFTKELLSQMVDNEANNIFEIISDESSPESENSNTSSLTRREKLLTEFKKRVKELRD